MFFVHRILQGYAKQSQNGFPRYVQKNVRNDVRTKLVSFPRSVSRLGKILRFRQYKHHRSVGKLFLSTVSENVYRHEQSIHVREQVSKLHVYIPWFIVHKTIIILFFIPCRVRDRSDTISKSLFFSSPDFDYFFIALLVNFAIVIPTLKLYNNNFITLKVLSDVYFFSLRVSRIDKCNNHTHAVPKIRERL